MEEVAGLRRWLAASAAAGPPANSNQPPPATRSRTCPTRLSTPAGICQPANLTRNGEPEWAPRSAFWLRSVHGPSDEVRAQPVGGRQAEPGRARPRRVHRARHHRRAARGRDLSRLRPRHPPRGPQPRLPPLHSVRGDEGDRGHRGVMRGSERFPSGPLQLAGHLARPTSRSTVGTAVPGLVLAHHFHTGAGGAAATAETYPELADRIATELGWYVLAFTCRGAGASEGQFSLGGWLTDIGAAISYVHGLPDVSGVWVAGFGTGAALSICAGARDGRVQGVAEMGGPADFDDWAGQPRRLLEYSREVGLVTDPRFPASFDSWSRELRAIRPLTCVTEYSPRSLLVVHGTDDDT